MEVQLNLISPNNIRNSVYFDKIIIIETLGKFQPCINEFITINPLSFPFIFCSPLFKFFLYIFFFGIGCFVILVDWWVEEWCGLKIDNF